MRGRRGSTLLELIVVGSVFLAMLTALWLIYDSTVTIERTVSLKVDLDREVYAAVRHVDSSLKTSRLVSPADWYNPQPVQTLQLMPLLTGDDGQPQITAEGFPQMGTPFTIVFENQQLFRVSDERRRLAQLGENGAVSFLRKSQGMLEMKIKADKVGFREQTTTREMTFELRLFNQ